MHYAIEKSRKSYLGESIKKEVGNKSDSEIEHHCDFGDLHVHCINILIVCMFCLSPCRGVVWLALFVGVSYGLLLIVPPQSVHRLAQMLYYVYEGISQSHIHCN